MKLPNPIREAMKPFLIAIVLFVQTAENPVNAMGKDLMREYRDSGVIGEKKTTVTKPTSGIIISKASESLLTPLVIDGDALFGSEFGHEFRLRYSFRFACLGWKYRIAGYMTNPGKEESSGWIVDLQSPDDKTQVNVKLVDVAFGDAFRHPLTEEQIQRQRAAQEKLDRDYQRSEASGIRVMSRYTPPYPDPMNREERILAGKEVIGRLLGKGVDGYKLAEGSRIRFSSETVSKKEFVMGEADLDKASSKKKCIVWALNISGYRPKNEPDGRRGNTWVCLIVCDPSDFSAVGAKARRILETLRFAASDQNVYPDLRD
jgi:hypothetical protein